MKRLSASVSAAAILCGGFGFAAPADAQEVSTLDDVMVTAQLRPQALADTPAAATVLTGDFIEAQGIRRFADVADFTPGLLVQSKSPGDSIFVLRGVSSGDGSSYQEPRVSVFLDGAPLSKARGAVFDLFDVERVDVLRGPQTSLFGRNALTGAVNVIQRKAGEGGGSLVFEAGSRGAGLVEAAADVFSGEDVGLRLGYRSREDAGRNADLLGGGRFGSGRTDTGKVAMAFTGLEAFRSDLILTVERAHGQGQSLKSGTFLPADPRTGEPLDDLSPFSGAALAEAPGFERGGGLGWERELENAIWLNRWTIRPGLTLWSTTAARRFENFETSDYDGFALPLLTVGDDAWGRQFSQDVRLNWTRGDLDVVAGGAYARERGSQRIPLQVDEHLVLALLTGQLDRTKPQPGPEASYTTPAVQAALLRGVAAARGVTISASQAAGIAANLHSAHREEYADHAKSDGVDIYADASWRLAGGWTVLAGARYGWLDKVSGLSSEVEGRSVLAGFLGALSLPAAQRQSLLAALATPGAADRPTSATFPVPAFGLRAQPTAGNEIQWSRLRDAGGAWRLIVKRDVNPNLMAYASYARGRRPSVLAPETPRLPGGDVTFDRVSAETLDGVELGAKARMLDGALRSDLALYGYRYRNFQTVIQQGAQYLVVDAGEASSWGLEGELRWRPASNLEVFAAGEVSHARFETGLFEGNRLAYHPDARLTVGGVLNFAAPGGELALRPVWSWRGEHYFSDDNGRPELMTGALVAPLDYRPRQAAYGVFGLDVEYEPAGAAWRIAVFARNLLDETYLVDAGNGGEDFGLPTYVAGERRLAGVRLTGRF